MARPTHVTVTVEFDVYMDDDELKSDDQADRIADRIEELLRAPGWNEYGVGQETFDVTDWRGEDAR